MANLLEYNFFNNFLIEIRPRLQSVNVLINLKETLKLPQISLKNDNITIINESIHYKIPCKKMRIIHDSLNNVQITDSFISFRFFTTNNHLGSFKSEVLQLKNNTENEKYSLFFNKDDRIKIQCVNCFQTYCEEKFKRILPLPSEHSDSSNWFCHTHENKSNENLNPSVSDIFYSSCYIHLHSKLMKGLIKSSTNLICKRCLAWIGIVLNENCFKIWFNTVQLNDGYKLYTTSALNDVCLSIRNVFEDSLLNSTKIILHCQVNKAQNDYILLWVIEKKLNIVINDHVKDFKDIFVAKVLFKFISGWNDLVSQWINDITVSNISISKPMMIDILKQLYSINKLLPGEWNSSNDFYISYLPLYNENQ